MNRDFKEIYSKINLENLDKVNNIIKRKNITLIILLILLLIFIFFRKIIFSNDIVMIIFAAFFIFILVINILTTIKYKKMFREIIIKKMVNLYNINLEYFLNKGIVETEYNESGFYKEFDKYHSENLISGRIFNKYFLKMAQVTTKKVEILKDDKGRITGKQDHIVFNGLYGEVNIKDLDKLEIEVAPNTIKSK